MDLLSHFLSLTPIRGEIDIRCQFDSPWRIDRPAATLREIPYHVLLQGTATMEDGGGNPLLLHAGDIVLFPSGDSHVLHDGSGRPPAVASTRASGGLALATNVPAATEATVDILCGRFLIPQQPYLLLGQYLPRFLHVRSAELSASDGPHAADTRLARLIQLMRDEARDEEPGSTSLVNHLSGALFGLALRYASRSHTPPRGLLLLTRRPRLQPALSAIFERPGEAWTLPRLAALCAMSRATFVRHFAEAAGRSAAQFLTEARMAMAARMLMDTTASAPEIGERVGYQSPAAFQRMFKKQTGMTPAQWRSAATHG